MFIYRFLFLIVKNKNRESFCHEEIKIADKQTWIWISPSLLLRYYIFDNILSFI